MQKRSKRKNGFFKLPQARFLIFFFLILGLLLVPFLVLQSSDRTETNIAQAAVSKKVVAYYVYWDKTRGLQTIKDNPDIFTEVSPWAYTLNSNGDVILDPNGGASVVDNESLSFFRANNILIVPAIHNLVNGTWNGNSLFSNILADPNRTQTHINNIINVVVSNNYDGIDIDYENLKSTDRQAYTNFMTTLAAELHARGKIITTDVYGKTSEPGGWNGPQAQDYQALGAVVDEVRIMLYDYNPSTVGPLAPYGWTNDVLTFAKTKIPAAKIIQGVPLYGYDWTGSGGNPVEYTWTDATAKAQQFGATIQWDETNKVPRFTYSSGGTHTVYFENSQSSGYKFDLTNTQGIGGVQFWRLGGEDPTTWDIIRTKFGQAATPTPTNSAQPTSTPVVSTPTPSPVAATNAIYADALQAGWSNSSFYATVNFANTSPVYQGTRSISFKSNRAWAGLGFRAPTAFSTSSYNYLSFAVRASKNNQNFAVYADASGSMLKTPVPLANYGGNPVTTTWKVYKIPLADLNAANKVVNNFVIQNNTASSQPVIYVDQVNLTQQ